MRDSAVTVRAIRGATQVDVDEAWEIRRATRELLAAVFEENDLQPESVISIFFTATPDIVSDFPALAAHEYGLADVPMICATEMNVPDVMPRVIRVLAHVISDRPRSALRHPYLRGAAAIRPEAVLEKRKRSGNIGRNVTL
ncbi:chorismate mutase [Streptomyces sp. OE57]|uniref:chorismate mutase n=1 Tax=Streptomyces lacaronensis TaxID=3379885 RepID=UPI0039B74FAD